MLCVNDAASERTVPNDQVDHFALLQFLTISKIPKGGAKPTGTEPVELRKTRRTAREPSLQRFVKRKHLRILRCARVLRCAPRRPPPSTRVRWKPYPILLDKHRCRGGSRMSPRGGGGSTLPMGA